MNGFNYIFDDIIVNNYDEFITAIKKGYIHIFYHGDNSNSFIIKLRNNNDLSIDEKNFIQAYCYYHGITTKKDYHKSFQLLLKCADKVDLRAKYLLARHYSFGKGCYLDNELALSLLLSIEKEFPLARFDIACFYLYDNGGIDLLKSISKNKDNYNKAYYYLKRGSNDSCSYCSSLLGFISVNAPLYRDNNGLNNLFNNEDKCIFSKVLSSYFFKESNKNEKEIELNFENAKNSDDATLQYSLAMYLYKKFKFLKYQNLIVDLLEASRVNSSKDAHITLCKIYLNRNFKTYNPEKGLELAKLLKFVGNIEYYYYLAKCYIEGHGVEVNHQKAFDYYFRILNMSNDVDLISEIKESIRSFSLKDEYYILLRKSVLDEATKEDNERLSYLLLDAFDI